MDGIGFVPVPENYIVGVDLDHCFDEHGNLAPKAQEIAALLNSYTERSPSGSGLRIFVKGILPKGWNKIDTTGWWPGAIVEAYQAVHYLTVTGNRLTDFPATLETRQAELEVFCRTVAERKAEVAYTRKEPLPPREQESRSSDNPPVMSILIYC